MRFCHLLLSFAVALSAIGTQPAVRAQTLPPKQDVGQQDTRPKLISSPVGPYPAEARKKDLEGKLVKLSIVVDAKGWVPEAKPLSGPPELFLAAVESVKQWRFEPPTHAPVVTTVEIAWGSPKECPDRVYTRGETEVSGRLLNKDGKVVGVCDSDDYASPLYPMEDVKAGVSGKVVLSVVLDTQGGVKEIHVVNSLSPSLDAAAVKAVRTWKFKLRAKTYQRPNYPRRVNRQLQVGL